MWQFIISVEWNRQKKFNSYTSKQNKMSHCHKHLKDFESTNMKTFLFISQGFMQTFIVPPKVEVIRVKLWGGGGGGASPSVTSDVIASGGGAGGYVEASLRVKPGETYIVVIGSGGEAAFGLDGKTGGDTSITGHGKLFVAAGGKGGRLFTPAYVGIGGEGGLGYMSGEISGFTSQGGSGSNSTYAEVPGDGGNATAGGSGGRGFTASETSEAGKLPGGGGGGGSIGLLLAGPFLGSPGANGMAIIYYDSPCELKSI